MSDAYFGNGGGNTAPSYQGDRATIWREIRKLQKLLSERSKPAVPPQEKAWSFSGSVAPANDITGPPWAAPANLILTGLSLTLAVASSTGYTVATVANGVLVHGADIPAGFTTWLAPMSIEVSKGQIVKPILVAQLAGTGEMLGIVYRWETLAK